MFTRTKIICTMGPAVSAMDKILDLIDAGMNVARINMSHGTHAEHTETIRKLKEARKIKNVPLAIMMDTKGPEIRIGSLKNGVLALQAGQHIVLVKEIREGDEQGISVKPSLVLDHLQVGTKVLFDDGYIIAKVIEKKDDSIVIEITNPGVLKNHKSMNIPDLHIPLPSMTPQDIADLTLACEQGVDLIAASFIQSTENVVAIKNLLSSHGGGHILVIAKIENAQGVKNFDTILQVADGIMVARGDLGVEMPLNQVPSLQKMMIRKCRQSSKPVVTATQMLESMINNPRPTRAEVSDVANAIYDGTSAVMLSGETAVGKYAINAAQMMHSIAEETEKDICYKDTFYKDSKNEYHDTSSSVALATVSMSYTSRAKAIFAYTSSGFTARALSRFRPHIPIIALTPSVKTYHQLAINWGVVPYLDTAENIHDAFRITSNFAIKKELVQYGDLVIVTAGAPFGISGTTNMVLIESIGDVLVRGLPQEGKTTVAQAAVLIDLPSVKTENIKGKIVVLTECKTEYADIIRGASGIVLQNPHEDEKSSKSAQEIAKALQIPILTRADNACSLLTSDLLITLNPRRGVVFRGIVDPLDD